MKNYVYAALVGVLLAVAIVAVCRAQERNEAEDAVALQIGRLQIMNTKLATLIREQVAEIARLKTKCGEPCADKPPLPTKKPEAPK